MADDNQSLQKLPSKNVPYHGPKARSLLIHGVFAKTATKIGMVATKATFLIKKILQTESPSSGSMYFRDKPKDIPPSQEDKNNQNEADKLVKLVQHSQEILAEATTVFPLTLFPDTMTIDRKKVTIHRRRFFFTDEAFSLQVEDVLAVTCSVGPLFGSVTIKIVMTGEEVTVNFFWRSDAIHLKHILQGYVIARNSKVDTEKLSKEQLVAMLEELGHDKNS